MNGVPGLLDATGGELYCNALRRISEAITCHGTREYFQQQNSS